MKTGYVERVNRLKMVIKRLLMLEKVNKSVTIEDLFPEFKEYQEKKNKKHELCCIY